MDINAGKILSEEVSLNEVGKEIFDMIIKVAGGEQTCSERLLHQEFVLGYKTFEPIGPSCQP
jgi:altronate dehydratase large subunit